MATISRPIQIEEFQLALRDITDSSLYTSKVELQRSVKKLERTNLKLDKLTHGETPKAEDFSDSEGDEYDNVKESDYELFHDIIRENELVIRNQQQRLDSIEEELSHRGLPSVEGTPVYSATTDESTSKKSNAYSTETYGVDTDNTRNGSANAVYL